MINRARELLLSTLSKSSQDALQGSGSPLIMTPTNFLNPLQHDAISNSFLSSSESFLGNNNDIFSQDFFQEKVEPYTRRDVEAIKELFKKLAVGTQLHHNIFKHEALELQCENINDFPIPKILVTFLQKAEILPAIQFIICDALSTGGINCSEVRVPDPLTNELVLLHPEQLIQELSPLIKSMGCTWNDFFYYATPTVLLRDPLLVKAMAVDNPEILLTFLNKETFDEEVYKPQASLSGLSISGYAKKMGKQNIAAKIEEARKTAEKDIQPINHYSEYFYSFDQPHREIEEATLMFSRAVAEIQQASTEYLLRYPTCMGLFSHKHQNQCRKMNELAKQFWEALADYSQVSHLSKTDTDLTKLQTAYHDFFESYRGILRSLSKGELLATLESNEITLSLETGLSKLRAVVLPTNMQQPKEIQHTTPSSSV